MRNVKRLLLGALVPALLAISGCGSNNAVGGQSLLNFTPAPSPRPSPSAVAQRHTVKPTASTVHRTAPPPPAVTVTVLIKSDSQQPPLMSPQSVTIKPGTIVKWTNRDTVPRGVEATGGAFKSPPIAPGASWSYTFTVPGSYSYQDSTRPYVTGQVQVS